MQILCREMDTPQKPPLRVVFGKLIFNQLPKFWLVLTKSSNQFIGNTMLNI